MNPILEFKDVSLISTKTSRLQKINFSVWSHEKVALIGKSGAGKTTLIKIANGTIKPTKGTIRLKGVEINQVKRKARSCIGTIWQDLRLIEELTVAQNINAGALSKHSFLWAIRNIFGLVNVDLCKRYLELVELPPEIINLRVDMLSGGQQQRVAIARLIRQSPELLLADEPISNLDPELVKKILSLLLQSKKIKNFKIPSTSIISLHRPEFIKDFSRVIGLKNGTVLFDLPTSEVHNYLLKSLYE